MKKRILSIVSVVIIFGTLFSCSQGKSLQELLQEEKKAIDQFIDMNGLTILKDYPKNGVFGTNEYYRTTDGLFFQVVDSGNGKRVQLANDVSIRYEYCQSIKDVAAGDTTKYYYPYHPVYYSSSPYQPMSFVYGISATYSSTATPVCQAWVIPLSYVGEEAVLNLIIPSALGSYYDMNTDIRPVFYKNLKYTRFN